jgi:hypothetical protein
MKSFFKQYGVSPEGLVLCLDQSDPRSYGDLANWHDLSPYANHGVQGTAGNQPAIGGVAGLSGMARTHDGISDFISCGSDASTKINANSSIAVWINFTNGAGLEVIAANCASGGYNGFYFAVYQGDLRMQISNGVGYYARAQTTDTIPSGWVHVAETYDGNEVELYVNGIQQSLTADTQGSGAYTSVDTLCIGARDGGLENFFHGSIGEIQAWDRLLSQGEMSSAFNAQRRKYGL